VRQWRGETDHVCHVPRLAQLMKHHILDTLPRRLYQLKVEVDVAATGQTAPATLHGAHTQLRPLMTTPGKKGEMAINHLIEDTVSLLAVPTIQLAGDTSGVIRLRCQQAQAAGLQGGVRTGRPRQGQRVALAKKQ